jgi:hypothetical protein
MIKRHQTRPHAVTDVFGCLSEIKLFLFFRRVEARHDLTDNQPNHGHHGAQEPQSLNLKTTSSALLRG